MDEVKVNPYYLRVWWQQGMHVAEQQEAQLSLLRAQVQGLQERLARQQEELQQQREVLEQVRTCHSHGARREHLKNFAYVSIVLFVGG